MPRKFSELRSHIPLERRMRTQERAELTLQCMGLHELRRARKQTQTALAENMGVRQSEVSKIEQRADMRLATLHDYVRGLGGELQLRAVFPEEEMQILVQK